MTRLLSLISLALFSSCIVVHGQVAKKSAPAEAPAISGKVWGALIHAKSGKPVPMPGTVPPELKDLSKRLGKVFNKYDHFEVLGDRTQDIFRQYESWVVPSKEFFLKLDSKGPSGKTGLKLDLQVWRLEKVLVKTDVVLRPESPLFIGGPKWRDGQLIFVLLLTENTHKK